MASHAYITMNTVRKTVTQFTTSRSLGALAGATLGAELTTFGDGAAALAAASGFSKGTLLLDAALPFCDGRWAENKATVVRRPPSFEPPRKNVPSNQPSSLSYSWRPDSPESVMTFRLRSDRPNGFPSSLLC